MVEDQSMQVDAERLRVKQRPEGLRGVHSSVNVNGREVFYRLSKFS